MQPLEVKVVKEGKKSVTIKILAINRAMPVPKETFEKRVAKGMYVLV